MVATIKCEYQPQDIQALFCGLALIAQTAERDAKPDKRRPRMHGRDVLRELVDCSEREDEHNKRAWIGPCWQFRESRLYERLSAKAEVATGLQSTIR